MLIHLPIVRLGARLPGRHKVRYGGTSTVKKHTKSDLTSALVAERLVVGELVASEGAAALEDVAVGTVEGRSTTECRTLKKR